MAELQAVKDIPYAIQSGRLVVRKQVFEHLEDVAKKKVDAQPQALKSICKLLQITLPRYADRKSTKIVDNFVKCLLQSQSSFLVLLIKTITDVAETYKNVQSTKAVGHICFAAFSWSCHVANTLFSGHASDTSDVQTLINSQALLLYSITEAQSNFLNKKSYRCATNLWKQSTIVIDEYLVYFKKIPESQASLVLIGFFVKYLVETKSKDALLNLKDQAIQMLCKVVVGSKTKPLPHVLETCSSLLRQITHNEFKTFILPALQKVLLRNPEIIFETVYTLISGVSLDLSQYALDLGKSIGTHLHSKEDQCREHAVIASKCLAQQCSSSQAIKDLLEHYFAILNGSEGKLTVVTQRLGVISGIGNLSYNIVTGATSIQALCEFATDNFISILKHEVHEGTVIHSIAMLSLWCSKFTMNVPSNLIELFQNGLTQKTSTFAIRNSYILCMNNAFHGNTLHQAIDLIPSLEKAYNKALAQPTQTNAVIEGLSVFSLFLKLYSFDTESETALKNIMNIDVNKLPFN
ncbi:eIF-2-alpha kinase activator GCN1 [Caerostris extrusa]|uniref:EIF-2-alpha kinase activator GCN1 n=1 Tax=Caerostris extrusa TaxID=172846 RepID=A0AAV4PX79_CAEEX|nr:eIF-2-alpha kinase activator GCN1 [Caerostris extrusa]